MKHVLLRIAVLIGLFLCVSVFPWWAVMVFAFVAAMLFENYYEVIALGILYDVQFHVPGIHWYLAGLSTLITIAIVIVSVIIQKVTQKPKILL